MNQTFSFQRLGLLIASHWAENKKRYTLSFFAAIGLLLLWFVFVMITDDHDPMHPNLQQVTFFFALFLVGPFYASQFFKDLTSKSKGINYLMMPASTLEKAVCGILYAVVLFFAAFTLAFYIVDVIAVMIANAVHPSYNIPRNGAIYKVPVVNVFAIRDTEDVGSVSKVLLLIFLAAQSLALLGSIYFGQYSYIKTAIAVCLVILFIVLIETLFFNKLLPPGSFNMDAASFVFYEPNDSAKMVKLPGWISRSISFLIQYAFAPIFWITTYFRLKEKEI